ncbi:MAG: hypothetical protein ACO1SV_02105 [Fimbriimonas sp.]
MRRSRFLPALILLGAAGCAPGPTPVHVDLNRLLAASTPKEPPAPELPQPPRSRGALTTTIKGLPADFLQDPSEAKESDVAKSIETQQRKARSDLERRLRAVYADQVRQFDLAVRRELEGARPAAYDEANRRIRALFEAYADRRVPRAYRLYDIVGFPDPNPESKPPRRPLGNVAQRLFDEAKELRAQLAAIEAEYDRDKNAILKDAADSLSGKEVEALARIRELADRLERQAAAEALKQVRTSVKDLGLQLTNAQPLSLPATPDRTVTIPAEPPLSPPPQVPSGGIPSGREDRRQRMERELKIWLGVNRYRLDPAGTDRTAEFQRWRESHRAGL